MLNSTSDIPRMAELIASYDWASAPLGAIESWPQSLRTAVDIMLASGHAMQLAWGQERTVLYNDAYAPMLGERHPHALGLPFREAWPDIWHDIEPLVERVFAGETVRFEDMPLVMTRHGYPEETWWNFSYSPVRDETGAVAGLLNVTVDATPRVRAERAERERDEGRRLQLAMLEVLPVGLALIGPDGHVIMSNPQWDRFAPGGQLPSRDATGCRRWRAWDSDGKAIGPSDFPGARALRGERCMPGTEFLYTDDSGAEVWTNIASVPLFDAHHEVTGAVSIIMDIDAAKQAQETLRTSEERHAFLLRLSDALRTRADPIEIQQAAMGLLAEQLDVMRATYFEVDADQDGFTLTARHERNAAPIPDHMRLSDFAPEMSAAYRAGRTLVFRDTETETQLGSKPEAYRPIGVRAWAAVPLVKDRRLVAIAGVHSKVARDWTEAEVGLLEEVAERTWAAVERARAEAAQRESESRFRALVTAGTSMVYRMSPDWRHMYQLSGRGMLTDTVMPVENWADTYLLPEDRPAIFSVIAEAIRTKSLFELEHRVRHSDGGIGWVVSRAVPILGPDGDIIEWFGAGSDVTARHEADERLRKAEERYRSELEQQVRERRAELKASHDLLQATMNASTDMIQVFEAIRDGAGEIVDFRWVLNNHTSETKYGRVEGESLLTRNPGVVQEGIFDAFKRVTEAGVPEQAEWHYVHEQFDGWFYQSVVKLGDGVATTTKEISDWKRAQEEVLRLKDEVAQARVREVEERFRQFADASTDVVWIRNAETLAMDYLNPAFEHVYGQPREEILANGPVEWGKLIHPDDRAAALAAVERVRGGERVTHEVRLLRPNGQVRWIENTDFPLFDAQGQVQRIAGFAKDVTEKKQTAERMKVLVAELQHRTRNLIGVVRSIADRTLACSNSLDAFREQFGDRLDGLARVNSLLSRLKEDDRISFDDLLRSELSGHGVADQQGHGPQVGLQGPAGVRLRSSMAQTLALGLHELTTNAVKYGALSRPEGQLNVRWELTDGDEGERRLRVEWRESGVPVSLPPHGQPLRQGYGRELIERALPYQLEAETSYELTPEGVRCTITLPISTRHRELADA